MTDNSKKQYTIKGKIIGTWNEHYVDIDVELTDNGLEQIKAQIKDHPECDDLRQIIEDDFPELHKKIQEVLIKAAYEHYVQEGIDDGMTREEAEGVELMGNEYSCPIPKDWPMKYIFQVMVAMTYEDKDIEVEVKLTEDEVNRIRELVAASVATEEMTQDEDDYVPEPDLLQVLDDGEPKLFKKFWDVIMPHVFVEMLINGIDNGDIEQHEDDNFFDYHEADFDDLYDMYGDEMELEHSSCCICRIPEAFVGRA